MKTTLLLTTILASLNLSAKVDYSKDLLPIIEKRCFECHGAEKDGKIVAKGKLDFNKIDSIKETFTAGKPNESTLYSLVISTDDEEWMPPKGARLTDEQKKTIHDWMTSKKMSNQPTPLPFATLNNLAH